ncbi:unnamed protein product [Cyprideis torosa]|uniref:Uncharacterized protein n=1 Tax=Cyprideis torosa TaxID=163714 RepID=A0A7R8W6S9_9CRUS|nr:unnamed protein product [Cyprideis torosa]CAG0881402.1 unnamed protein product [Cyprideis torosa]
MKVQIPNSNRHHQHLEHEDDWLIPTSPLSPSYGSPGWPPPVKHHPFRRHSVQPGGAGGPPLLLSHTPPRAGAISPHSVERRGSLPGGFLESDKHPAVLFRDSRPTGSSVVLKYNPSIIVPPEDGTQVGVFDFEIVI